jgi:hypothetical protein
MKTLLTAAVLSSMCSFAGLATAQSKQGDVLGADVSSQCAKMSDPRVKDDCVRLLRNVPGRVVVQPAVQGVAMHSELRMASVLG